MIAKVASEILTAAVAEARSAAFMLGSRPHLGHISRPGRRPGRFPGAARVDMAIIGVTIPV